MPLNFKDLMLKPLDELGLSETVSNVLRSCGIKLGKTIKESDSEKEIQVLMPG